MINTATNRPVVDIPLDGEPTDVAIGPAGTHAYVALFREHAIGVLDIRGNKVERTVPVSPYPIRLALSGDGTFAFVIHNGSNEMSVIDTRTFSVATLRLATPADDIAGPPLFRVR